MSVRSCRGWLAAALCLGAASLAGCGETPAPLIDESKFAERANELTVEDVAVVITSGTTTLRDVRASHAVFHEDTRFLEASSVTLTLLIPERGMGLTAHASRGEVFLAGDKKKKKPTRPGMLEPPEPPVPAGPVGFEAMRELAYRPEEEHPFGDVILYGPVIGKTTDGGTFHTQTVYWSEKRKRLMVPNAFTQKTYLPDGGGVLHMSGSAFEVDSDLQEWVYYAKNELWTAKWKAAEEDSAAVSESPVVDSPSSTLPPAP